MNKTLVTNSVLRHDGGRSDVSSPEFIGLDLQSNLTHNHGASPSSGPIMLQALGQLVYTSFPQVGFRHLSSSQIPDEIQHAFVDQVVYLRWNSYNPPGADYRAAYLYQVNPEHTLFGWLYGDATDDVGRHVPYFVSYHLAEPLTDDHLDNIFICLQRGPTAIANKQDLSEGVLGNISIADVHEYPPARIGVDIPDDIRNYSHTFLQMQELLNIFIPASSQQSQPALRNQGNHKDLSQSLTAQNRNLQTVIEQPLTPRNESIPEAQLLEPTPTSHFDPILQELISKPIGIQSALLVSLEGLPITTPVGISENSALIIAGTMLYLARSTNEELQWQGIEKISVQAQEGYVILASCTPDVFLLVKTAKALSGLLDGEINRTVKRLQMALQLEGITEDTELSPDVRNELVTQLDLDKPIAETAEEFNPAHEMNHSDNSVQ